MPELDGVRAVAALMVFVFHVNGHVNLSGGWGFLQKPLNLVVSLGQTGVPLFFVLSGFLITRILLAAKNKPNYYKNFFARRALRIFPLYYFYLVLVVYVVPWISGGTIPGFGSVWWHFIYLQNIPTTYGQLSLGPVHYWSLAVEEHFYFIWPLFVYRLNGRWLVAVISGMILMSFASRGFLYYKLGLASYLTVSHFDGLVLGGALALVDLEMNESRRKIAARLVMILGLAVVVLSVLTTRPGFDPIEAVVRPFMVALIYACFIGWLLWSEKTITHRVLSLPWLCFIGGVSYGIYVYHPLVLELLVPVAKNIGSLAFLVLGLITTIGISILSFRLFEAPIGRFKRLFQ